MPQLSRQLQEQVIRSDQDPSFRLWAANGVLVPEDTLLYYKLNNDFRSYEEIESDAVFGRLCEERRESPSLREVKVYSGGSKPEDELAAEIVRKTIDRLDFDHLCSSLNHAIFTGRTFAELIWGSANLTLHIEDSDIDRECYIPVKVEPKDPARLIFGKASDDRKTQHHMGFEVKQTTFDAYTQGVALPIRKAIVHSYGSLYGNPFGKGVYRRLYWLNNFKKEVLKLGLINSDGRPIPVIRYGVAATPAEIRDAEVMLADFYKNSWMLLPDSMQIEFATAFVQNQVSSLQSFLTWFDTQASMSILGATLTSQTDNSATRGDSSIHYKVTESRAKSDSDLLSESLKEYFVKPIVELNAPGAALPGVYRDFSPPIDREKEAKIDQLLFTCGFKPTEKRLAETYGDGNYEAIAAPMQLQQQPQDNATGEDDEGTEEDEDPIDLPDELEDDAEDDEADLQEWAEFGWIIKRKLNFTYGDLNFAVGLEFAPGDIRFPGKRYSKKLRSGYGHLRNYVGKDKEALDAYIDRSLLESDADRTLTTIWAIEQIHPDGSPDELKLILGAKTAADAIDLYLKEMPQERLGGVRRLSVDELKGMRRSGVEAVRDEDTDEFGEAIEFSEEDGNLSEVEWTADFDEVWGVWFGSRRTPILVRAKTRPAAIAAARKKKRRGGDNVESARHLKDWEKKQARGGKWLRSGPRGEKPGELKRRGFGPKPGSFTASHSEIGDATIEFSDNIPTNPKLWQRCLVEAKKRFRVHPSARSNQFAAKLYKSKGGKWKTKSKSDYSEENIDFDLRDWQREDWREIRSDGSIGDSCGSGNKKAKPRCLPLSRLRSMTKEERIAVLNKKRRSDPNAKRRGKPRNISTQIKRR